jgi:prepilin-type N-terminal cleavage/methylation domain-containing protein
MKNLRKRTEGFTIIEVMIVLVIAAVILLMVFLAIPALQRNSRNTQRREDVSNYAAAIAEWSNNSAGVLPSTAANLTDATTGVNALANTGFLVEPTTVTAAAATVTNTATIASFLYVPGTLCSGTNATNTNASTRQFTLLYAVENSNGTANPQCLAS